MLGDPHQDLVQLLVQISRCWWTARAVPLVLSSTAPDSGILSLKFPTSWRPSARSLINRIDLTAGCLSFWCNTVSALSGWNVQRLLENPIFAYLGLTQKIRCSRRVLAAFAHTCVKDYAQLWVARRSGWFLMSLCQLANLFFVVCAPAHLALTSENILQCKVNHSVVGWIPSHYRSESKVPIPTAQNPTWTAINYCCTTRRMRGNR